nr:MAG TPA: hypothetical protein [Caudoviricetes sp.]
MNRSHDHGSNIKFHFYPLKCKRQCVFSAIFTYIDIFGRGATADFNNLYNGHRAEKQLMLVLGRFWISQACGDQRLDKFFTTHLL